MGPINSEAKWSLRPDLLRPSPRREPSRRHPIVAGRGGYRGGILIPPRYQVTADHIVLTAAAIFRTEY
jgi:hypothetical protein